MSKRKSIAKNAPLPREVLARSIESLIEKGEPAEALRYVDDALTLAKDARLHRVRARALEALGRWDEGLSALEAALRLEPDSPQDYVRMAELCRAAGNAAAARDHVQGALALAPGHASAYFVLGEIEQGEGRTEAAIEAFRSCLRGRQGSRELATRSAIKIADLLQPDRPEEAREALRLVLALDPASDAAREAQARLDQMG